MINVMILRTCGIPATIDEVPYWGSRNGSHASDVFWSAKEQKMITGYEREFVNDSLARRPAKVVRYTFHYTSAFNKEISLYLKGEEFQIPQMAGNHWYDATADHTSVSDVHIPVRKEIADRMELGYLYVRNYDDWVPVHYGRVMSDTLCFTSMGRDLIYRAGFYSAGKDYFITPPFLLDSLGGIKYSEPDTVNNLDLLVSKINHGLESDVKSRRSYTLRYLDNKGTWIDHDTKRCENEGELTFKKVPSVAFYFLFSSSDQRHLARIFLIGEKGQQLWY